jgi:hypothetical protein
MVKGQAFTDGMRRCEGEGVRCCGVRSMNNFPACTLPTLSICADALNTRMDTARHMLALALKHPGVLSVAVCKRYHAEYFRAQVQLEKLHTELEHRIADDLASL